MSKIMEIISSRLDNKELLSCEIPRLIRDVFNISAITGEMNHSA